MPDLTVSAHDGGSFKAYIARPDITPAPVIIMIQEIFGINQEMRDKCDEMAQQGYIAICPDLFWRIEPEIELIDSKPEELQRAFDLFGQFNVEMGIKDLNSTLKHMRTHDLSNGKVACVGYCLGGKLAYLMSTQTDIEASVAYYGVGIEEMTEEAANIKNPLLMHMAEEDEFVSKEAQSKVKQDLSNYSNITIHSYAGVNHAFARGQGVHYNAQAAQKANERTRTFLKEHLS